MGQDFLKTTSGVCLERTRYVPSEFARSALFYLQETGRGWGQQPYTCSFGEENSCLFLIVEGGQGKFWQDGIGYSLQKDSVVFVKCGKGSVCCMEAADGRTSVDDAGNVAVDDVGDATVDNIGNATVNLAASDASGHWKLVWCRFYGDSMPEISQKYLDCGGQPASLPEAPSFYKEIMERLHALADSSDDVRDMRINQELNSLFTLLMEEPGYQKDMAAPKSSEIGKVKKYLDEHYMDKVTLDGLEEHFGISKYYMTKLFRKNYDRTIIGYVQEKRIAKAKLLLRTTDMAVEEVGPAVGIDDMNYFCRIFRKLEGKTPGQFRRKE